MMRKIGILLSGCGVYDGAEIQESVLTMLAIKEAGAEYISISVDKNQHHVINHLTGDEMPETRNMMEEAARIARGDVKNIRSIDPADIDALVIPGGFGSAKNFTSWAFDGAKSNILPEVKLLLVNMINVGKPICALCVSPIVVAKAMESGTIHPTMTIGSTKEESEYDINAFSEGLIATGSQTELKTIREICIDQKNKIISAPCYMMEADIVQVRENIKKAIEATFQLID